MTKVRRPLLLVPKHSVRSMLLNDQYADLLYGAYCGVRDVIEIYLGGRSHGEWHFGQTRHFR